MNELPENVRPWGRYDILDETDAFKVKRMTLIPGGRVSYQLHRRRTEYWVIVGGTGRVTLNDAESDHVAGDVVVIPVLTKHRIQNTGSEPLVFIEVQTGDYFGEDDIERFSDDYGRS